MSRKPSVIAMVKALAAEGLTVKITYPDGTIVDTGTVLAADTREEEAPILSVRYQKVPKRRAL